MLLIKLMSCSVNIRYEILSKYYQLNRNTIKYITDIMNKNYMEANPHTDPDNISTSPPDDTTETPNDTTDNDTTETPEKTEAPPPADEENIRVN